MRLKQLYKKATNGNIMLWHISTRDYGSHSIIFTLHGYVNGAIQEDSQTIREGKNIGRSNETSIAEQAELEAYAKWKKQKEKGYTEDSSGVSVMNVYLPMLAQKYKERSHMVKWPCYSQPKLNGARCISYIDMKVNKRVYQSRLGKFWTTLSHLDDELGLLGDDIITDGEIYVHGMDLQDILSLIKNQDTTKSIGGLRSKDLQYWIYDIVDIERPFIDRSIELIERFSNFKPEKLVRVDTLVCGTSAMANVYFKKNLEDGFEGSILRNGSGFYAMNKRSNDLQKVKTILDDEFEIVGGYQVETGREEGTCIFTCKTKEGLTFDVRPKGTLAQRVQYWNDLPKLVGSFLTCEFQEWTSDKKPFHARGVAVRDYE